MAASHGQFVDVLAMATTGTKGPTNVTRIAADANGNLVQSIKGAAYTPLSGSSVLPQTLILADATTNTAPDGIVERHTTSGTAAANFGLTDSVELQSAAGNVRRVMTDVTALTTATDGAEVASRTIQIMSAGALANSLTLNAGGILVPDGTGALPSVSFASVPTTGFYWSAANTGIGVTHAGSQSAFWSATTLNLLSNAAKLSLSDVSVARNVATGSMDLSTAVLGIRLQTNGKYCLQANPAAVSGLTASVEAPGVDWNLVRTATFATGALATQREFLVRAPTYAFAGASTITSAATLAIAGAPIAGTNATITNAYSLWVQAGATRLDGNFGFNAAPVAQQNTTGTATGFTAGAGTAVNDQSTFTGGTGATAYRISDIVLALKNYGLLAA